MKAAYNIRFNRTRFAAPVIRQVRNTAHTMAIDPLITNTLIDSCAFDPKYEPESTASLEIFRLSEKTDLIIEIAHSTQKEIEHPNTPKWVKDKAKELIYTIQVQLTPNEKAVLRDIENILAGNGKVENIAQDARHVFEAQKYGSYFITTDDRILRRADALRRRAGVEVVRPSEFLAIVKMSLAAEGKKRA
jgi:predicted nucleic acid-binding protein